MPKTDNVRQVDLPRATGSGPVYIRGGGAGGVSNADTVDGYHASSTPTAGKLLALNASAQFNPSVIDWASVAGAGLSASGDTLVVRWGSSPTTIVPDAATAGGSAPTSARSDHTHAIAAAAPSTNLSVTSANAEGSATSFARSDHSHAITSSANPGAAASILASSASGYLQLVRLGLGVAPSYPLQVQGTTPQLRLQQDAGNYTDFEVDAGGDLTIEPSGDSLLVPSGKTLASANWMSQTTGWGIYPESTYGRDGYADFRYIYADELHVKAFIADLEQALAGGQIIAKSVAIIAVDFTVPAKGTTGTLYVEDLPGTEANVFAEYDWVRIRNISRSGGGLVVEDCYGLVNFHSRAAGVQRYAYSRPAGDTGSAVAGTVVQKGGLALDYGVSGNGYWEVTTLDPAGSPYAQVATWAGHPQNLTVRARLGNLDGIAGIGAEWGLWAGKDSNHWIKVSDAGAEIKGLKQTWIDAGGNTRGQVDPTATGSNYLFWLGPSSGDKRFGVTADGTVYIGNVPSSNIAGWAHASDLTKIDGGDIYANTITAESLLVHGTNWIANSGFETNSFVGWTVGGGSPYIGTSTPHSGKCYAVAQGSGTATVYPLSGPIMPVDALRNYVISAWVRNSTGTGGAGVLVQWIDAANSVISTSGSYGAATTSWTRKSVVATAPSNARYMRLFLVIAADNTSLVSFDDVEFYAADGNVLVGTPGGARVEINNAGIEGYDSSGDKQFYIRTSDGRAMFGAGHGVLDASGLSLDGTSGTSGAGAIAWRTVTDPAPGGSLVAYLSSSTSGFNSYSRWDTNLHQHFSEGTTQIVAYGNSVDRYSLLALRSTASDTGGTAYMGVYSQLQAKALMSMDAATPKVYFATDGATRLTVNNSGIDVVGSYYLGARRIIQSYYLGTVNVQYSSGVWFNLFSTTNLGSASGVYLVKIYFHSASSGGGIYNCDLVAIVSMRHVTSNTDTHTVPFHVGAYATNGRVIQMRTQLTVSAEGVTKLQLNISETVTSAVTFYWYAIRLF